VKVSGSSLVLHKTCVVVMGGAGVGAGFGVDTGFVTGFETGLLTGFGFAPDLVRLDDGAILVVNAGFLGVFFLLRGFEEGAAFSSRAWCFFCLDDAVSVL
jgi:hypothetical protein